MFHVVPPDSNIGRGYCRLGTCAACSRVTAAVTPSFRTSSGRGRQQPSPIGEVTAAPGKNAGLAGIQVTAGRDCNRARQ